MDNSQNDNNGEIDILGIIKDSGFMDLPHYSIKLYQNVNEIKNIIPVERRYHEK